MTVRKETGNDAKSKKLLFKQNIWSLVKCNGFESEFEVQFEWEKFWFLTSIFLVLFISCTIMVAVAGGFV